MFVQIVSQTRGTLDKSTMIEVARDPVSLYVARNHAEKAKPPITNLGDYNTEIQDIAATESQASISILKSP